MNSSQLKIENEDTTSNTKSLEQKEDELFPKMENQDQVI